MSNSKSLHFTAPLALLTSCTLVDKLTYLCCKESITLMDVGLEEMTFCFTDGKRRRPASVRNLLHCEEIQGTTTSIKRHKPCTDMVLSSPEHQWSRDLIDFFLADEENWVFGVYGYTSKFFIEVARVSDPSRIQIISCDHTATWKALTKHIKKVKTDRNGPLLIVLEMSENGIETLEPTEVEDLIKIFKNKRGSVTNTSKWGDWTTIQLVFVTTKSWDGFLFYDKVGMPPGCGNVYIHALSFCKWFTVPYPKMEDRRFSYLVYESVKEEASWISTRPDMIYPCRVKAVQLYPVPDMSSPRYVEYCRGSY